MKHTYLLIAALCSSPAPYRTYMYLVIPEKIRRRLYNFCVLNSGVTEPNLTKFLQEMIVNYSSEIKTAIFQSVSERQGDEWRSSSNCGRIAAKIVRFNSVNSEIIGRKFTKFVYNVARLLPFNPLKAASRSSDPLLNARATSKGRSCRWLRTSPKFHWLP